MKKIKVDFLKCTTVTFICFFLNSCIYTYGVSKKVDPKDYPEAKIIQGLDLYMMADEDFKSSDNKYGIKYYYNPYTGNKEQKDLPKREDLKGGCYIDVDWVAENSYGKIFSPTDKWRLRDYIGKTNSIISALSLYIIPYYEPVYYDLEVKLRSAKDGSLLKEYKYRDKYYLVASSFSFFFVLPFISRPAYDNIPDAVKYVRENVKTAYVREITNDVYEFPECYVQGVN